MGFQHRPLAPNEIRLCRLQQGQPKNGQFQLELQHFSFEGPHSTTYTALSYTWGPENPSFEIQINGASFRIRQNLLEFMASTQRLGRLQTWFWIDQICINQNNIPERNSEVRRMSDIYTKAVGVTSWLGKEADSSDLALDFMTVYAQSFATDERLIFAANRKSSREDQLFAAYPHHVIALAKLLDRPYFRRLWIIQEVFLAESVTIRCGTSEHIFQAHDRGRYHFLALVNGLQRHSGKDYAHIRSLFDHGIFGDTDKSCHSQDMALTIFCTLECFDLRDKVYGLQGCIVEDEKVEVDYNDSVEDVYWKAVRKVCEQPYAIGYDLQQRKVKTVSLLDTEDVEVIYVLREAMQLTAKVTDETLRHQYEAWMLEFHNREPHDLGPEKWKEMLSKDRDDAQKQNNKEFEDNIVAGAVYDFSDPSVDHE